MFQQLVTIVPWNFVAAICNLLIQMWLIKKFLFKPVQKVLAQRQQMADAQIADAEKARTEAEAMRTDYEQRLAEAKEEAAQLVQSATRTAWLRGEEIVRQAQADAASIKTKADADIAQQRKKAINEVKDEIGGIAMDIASKVVEREIDPKVHQDLIDEFIRNVGDAS